ncbi:MAG TPA: hypothetical protein VHV77_13080, partial [Pirellulales bacterium]|nr:hypothetical protein [Pirellulales bacterium]
MTSPTASAPVGEPAGETFDTFTAVFTEIDAAKAANVKRPEFGTLVDKLSDAITKAKETAKTPAGSETLDGYAQVLQIYKDSIALWDIKLRLPEMAEVAEKAIKQKTAAGAPDTDPEIMKGYDFNIATLSGIPLQQYPSGDTGVEAFATKYALPITDRNGWRIVPSDSVSLVWKKASDKL